jgi:hypothetical protein
MNPIAYNSLLVKKPLVLEEKTSRVMQVQKWRVPWPRKEGDIYKNYNILHVSVKNKWQGNCKFFGFQWFISWYPMDAEWWLSAIDVNQEGEEGIAFSERWWSITCWSRCEFEHTWQ